MPLLARDGSPRRWTVVDEETAEWMSAWAWRLSSGGYAVRSETSEGKKRTVYLHREIMLPPERLIVDHANGDKLDNRRSNLRFATVAQNNANSKERPRKSQYRGVYWHGVAAKWVAQISTGGSRRHLGLFDNEEDAARAFDVAASATHGPFATLNFPPVRTSAVNTAPSQRTPSA